MGAAWRRAVLVAGFGHALGRICLAGVENTHHDMRLYSLEQETSVCGYCHVPHGAAGEGLLKEKGTTATEIGAVGSFCYTCHDGTVVPTALIEAPDGTLGIDALTKSHGLLIRNIEPKTFGLEKLDQVRASGLIPLDPATGSLPERMECTACHDPHNASNPPFLKLPLAILCQKCHSGRDVKGGGRFTSIEDVGPANGAHPVGMSLTYSGRDRKRPEQAQPEIIFNDVDAALRVVTLAGPDLGDPAKHWATGGHLSPAGAQMPTGTVSCATCHSAHSVAADLLVAPVYQGAGTADSPLCQGCHGARSSPENPGGTPYFHPVGLTSGPPYMTTPEPRRPLAIVIPPDWPVGKGGSLICATCHRAHQGRQGARCLRDNALGKKYSCDVCHQPEEQAAGTLVRNTKNLHHVTSTLDKSALLQGRGLSWAKGPGEPGDLADGLTCIDCHVDLAKSAHNW
ncbi:MAG: hypothetical protein HZB55_01840 [Deltaproteobacteria bacterium]|nr:hypothetical protein [Deltaproteobacteria bacterium]